MDNRIMSFDEFVAKDQSSTEMTPQIQPEMPAQIEPAQSIDEPMMPVQEPAMEPAAEPQMVQPAAEPGQDQEGLEMLEEPTL